MPSMNFPLTVFRGRLSVVGKTGMTVPVRIASPLQHPRINRSNHAGPFLRCDFFWAMIGYNLIG